VIHNLANMGRFSSDRTIQEYADQIWDARPVPVRLDGSQPDGGSSS
jgi:starch phosphorylase